MKADLATAARTIPRPSIADALATIRAEHAAALALLQRLDDADWECSTDCPGWTVHNVVAHMVGQNEELARPDRLVRRVRQARRSDDLGVLDAHNRRQVQERAHASPGQLIAELARWGPRAARAAGRIPGPLRRIRLSMLFPEARDQPEDTVDFLVRVLMVRDLWMHRSDIAAATARSLDLGPHDREVVRQVMRDLALGWTAPAVLLQLTGPAGGCYSLGDGAPVATVRADAIAYLRLLSGRPADVQPTTGGDPDAAASVLAARMPF